MVRYEKRSAIVMYDRPLHDRSPQLHDVVVVAPQLDRVGHHGRLLRFEGKSWRLTEAAARSAQRATVQ